MIPIEHFLLKHYKILICDEDKYYFVDLFLILTSTAIYPTFHVFCKPSANKNIKQPLSAIHKFPTYKILKRELNNCDLLMYLLSSMEEMCLEKTLLNVDQLSYSISNRTRLKTCLIIVWQINKFQTCNSFFFQILLNEDPNDCILSHQLGAIWIMPVHYAWHVYI